MTGFEACKTDLYAARNIDARQPHSIARSGVGWLPDRLKEFMPMRHTLYLLASFALLPVTACAPANDGPAPIAAQRIVDLTHAFDDDTIYWPTDTRGFRLEQLAAGNTDAGWYYSANAFCTAEHGGTHIDAPVHFFENGQTVDEIPLSQLIGPAVIIDVADNAAADADYRLTIEDVAAHEAQYGRIPDGSIVLLRTGWSERWPDARVYLGDDTPGDASKLSFPSYGEEAARLLVQERAASMLGIDTASIDYGRSTDFPVHRIAAENQVAGLENLTNLDALPVSGFTLIALPIKIGGGSGGPVRVIALLDHE
jgi:kynurenine formamidase